MQDQKLVKGNSDTSVCISCLTFGCSPCISAITVSKNIGTSKLPQWWCGAYSRSALLSSSYYSGCWLVTLRRKTLRLWWQSLFSQCNSPFYTIKVTLYDSCQLAWLAQFRIEGCVWSSQRSGLDSRSSQAWIFQVLFQPLRLFIIYWEHHLHPYKVPTRYKAVHFLTNLNLSKAIYLNIVTYYKDKKYTLFCLEELQKFIPLRR